VDAETAVVTLAGEKLGDLRPPPLVIYRLASLLRERAEAYFASSTAGAKETTSTQGSASRQMRDRVRTGVDAGISEARPTRPMHWRTFSQEEH